MSELRIIRRSSLAAAVLVSLAGANVAVAQDDDLLAVEEITVTARKVEESLQDIPLTITAFSAEDIENAGLESIDDVANFTPGLHINNYTGVRNDPGLRFRGMDNGTRTRYLQNSSAFIDGIYLPGSAQLVPLDDVAQVEIVKGPQSAFFGRATFGGAVNFITRTPGDEFRGRVGGLVGENGEEELTLSLEGPLAGDWLKGRLSVRSWDYDGAYRNAVSGDDLGAQSTDAISGTLVADFDTVNVKFHYLYSEDDDGPAAFFTFGSNFNNCGPFTQDGLTGTRDYFCGILDQGQIPELGYDTSVNGVVGPQGFPESEFGLDRFTNLANLTVNWDIGEYTLTSTSGYFTENTSNMSDFSGTQPGNLLSYGSNNDKVFSQEVRLASPQDRRFTWQVGAFYLDANYRGVGGFGCASDSYIVFGFLNGCQLFVGGPTRGTFDITESTSNLVENRAIFGAVSFAVNDRLTLSLEARSAKDEIDQGTTVDGDGNTLDLSDEFSSFTPRFVVDYKPNDNTTLYFNYSQGNKPGTFNADIADLTEAARQSVLEQFGIPLAIEEEDLENFEFGIKTLLADGRLALQAAAYFGDWTNQQFRQSLQGVDTNGDGVVDQDDETQLDVFGQAGESTIKGVEIGLQALISQNWNVDVGYNYNTTEYDTFDDEPYSQVFGSRDASGNRHPRSPEHSAVLSSTYRAPMGDSGMNWFVRGDATYNSTSYTWAHNLAETGDWSVVNLRGGIETDTWRVTLFVNNLNDNNSIRAIRRFTDLYTFQTGYAASLPRPREVGLRASWNF